MNQKSDTIYKSSVESVLKRTESEISNLSFKHWHKRMQIEHELLERSGKASPFKLWKCCDKSFRPCRWFDSIDYNKKICKCCLKFKTFKNIVTIILAAVFLYSLMYSLLEDEVLPGGTVFFLFFLFVTAWLVGYIVTLVGMPGMLGHLVTGITFGNVPRHWLPNRDEEFIETVTKIAEKLLLILSLIRSGLLLDLSRMKNRLRFIFCIATVPFLIEFLIVWIVSHYLLKLDWDWSALQGSTISIVSLATVTSIMEKNKKSGYGEDKHLSTVLIAAAVVNVLVGLLSYFICITFVIEAVKAKNDQSLYWKVPLIFLKESAIGVTVGIISGFLVSFFPDKRNPEAAGLRIILLGVGSFGIIGFFNAVKMNMAGTLGCLILCLICTNMWEELGWHQDSNPVLYFYTMAYYIGQPVVLSLLGYTMKLKGSSGEGIGLSFAVFLIGLAGREIMCCIVLQEKSYPTALKEKTFICIAWLSKGTFQALLAFSVFPYIEREIQDLKPSDIALIKGSSEIIERTTILAVFLTTPLVCYGLILLTPLLLTTTDEQVLVEKSERRKKTSRARLTRISITRYKDTIAPTRKISLAYYSDLNLLENNSTTPQVTPPTASTNIPVKTGRKPTRKNAKK